MYARYDLGFATGANSFAPTTRVHFGAKPAPKLRSGVIVDLAADIGSRRWWRGLATCTALCGVLALFAPSIEALPGVTPAPYADAQWEQAKTLAIAPLAYGADTGARMAATDAVRPIDRAPERPRISLSATLGRGDGFARVLERSGVGGAEAAQVAAIVERVTRTAAIRPGTGLTLTLGPRADPRSARPLERLAFRARLDLAVVVERVAGQLVLRPQAIAVDATPLRIGGRVGSSLYFSARAAGVPARAIQAYIRTLAAQISLSRDIAPDDRFDIIVSHQRTGNGEAETGPLLYAGLDRASGRDVQLLPWTTNGRTQWFEASGVGRTSGTMSQPVAGPISSGFGPRRHPILRYLRMHRGLDFRARHGQPIYAATSGTVTRAGWAGGYGKQVRIAHAGGLATSYSHMSRIAAEPGAAVRQGQVIGYVGSTGLSTGPHLHYELYRGGVAVDPRSVRFVTRSLLEGAELMAFRARLQELLALQTGTERRS